MALTNRRDGRRQKIVSALNLLQEICEETPDATVIDQTRRGLYSTTIFALKGELSSIKGDHNASLYPEPDSQAALRFN